MDEHDVREIVRDELRALLSFLEPTPADVAASDQLSAGISDIFSNLFCGLRDER